MMLLVGGRPREIVGIMTDKPAGDEQVPDEECAVIIKDLNFSYGDREVSQGVVYMWPASKILCV